MEENVARTTPADPALALLNLMTGYWASQALYVAAKLNLADACQGSPRTVEELAAAAGADPSSLGRLLRALATVGVFAEGEAGVFSLTPMGALLRSDRSDSVRALAIMYAEEQYHAWGHLLHSVRTGQASFDHLYGMGVFEYYKTHPESARTFDAAMTELTTPLASVIAETCDFSRFETIVDVGGGYGVLLAAVLQRNAQSRGILFDLPHVVEGAASTLVRGGIADRCASIGGDFFESIPAGGDAYLLKQVLHDWDDDRCVAILKNCRRVMPSTSRLLLIEFVLPPGNEPFLGKWVDLHMLVMAPGARERTVDEYQSLLLRGGFTMCSAVPTPIGPSVVEAMPVEPT
jgi:O-methyltransferase domain/Dimerisation domain